MESNWVYCEKGKGKMVHVKVCKACEKVCKVRKELGVIRIAKKAPKKEEDKIWK